MWDQIQQLEGFHPVLLTSGLETCSRLCYCFLLGLHWLLKAQPLPGVQGERKVTNKLDNPWSLRSRCGLPLPVAKGSLPQPVSPQRTSRWDGQSAACTLPRARGCAVAMREAVRFHQVCRSTDRCQPDGDCGGTGRGLHSSHPAERCPVSFAALFNFHLFIACISPMAVFIRGCPPHGLTP